MATLAFAAVGSALGSAVGGTVLGVSAAVIGQAVGAAVGSAIDAKLFGGGQEGTTREGPRLDNLDVMTAQEGASLPDLSGRAAIAGEVIWATRLEEVVDRDSDSVGSGKNKTSVDTVAYRYRANFAVSLCEGPAAHLGRVWADGRLLDVPQLMEDGVLRFYRGTESQSPDPLIEAKEGHAPAFRGVAYLVFDGLDLSEFGERVPQIKAEVWGASGDLEPQLRGVNIIPSSTEWGYYNNNAVEVRRSSTGVRTGETPLNSARHASTPDWNLSIDLLEGVLPEVDTLSLVVAWFGSDMRAGQCLIQPRVEYADRTSEPVWSAAGRTYATAGEVSRDAAGRPAFGGSPSDFSIIRAIRDARDRGMRVVLYPFILMDVREDQALPHPSGAGVQPNYPWRGRVEPAAGEDVSDAVAAFLGNAQPGDFFVHPSSAWKSGSVVTPTTPDWRFRHFILHLAHLAAAANGVDAFLIGTEMRGMTFAREGYGNHPFVDGLVQLAADVKSIIPGTAVSYAADWSEYHSFRDGGEVTFHLDPLWSSSDVDFIGIDNYLPLSDWRDGTDHLDYQDGLARSPYDLEYLKGNVEGGEYWDFFYASEADRIAQIRTPIADGLGKPWVFRQKGLRDWWSNAHYNRPSPGTESGTATAWSPSSKPVWFTELGCPAVDKGPNQPNVFVSRLSSESFLPHFSAGTRDDFAQRQYLRAMLEVWDDIGGAMLDMADIQVWAWDARPWPEFPRRTSLWSDGPDWQLGHWLNGRAGAAPALETIRRRADRHGLPEAALDLTHAHGQADGYPAPGPITFREWLQPLELGLGILAIDSGEAVSFERRDFRPEAAPLTADALVDTPELFSLRRDDLVDVPRGAVFQFRNGNFDYETATARAQIGGGNERGTSTADTPLVLDFDRGQVAVARILRSRSEGRERAALTVPRSRTDLAPGAVVSFDAGVGPRVYMVARAIDAPTGRELELASYPRGAFGQFATPLLGSVGGRPLGSSTALLRVLDVPLLARAGTDPWDSLAVAHAAPWGGTVALAVGASETGPWDARSAVTAPGTLGELLADLPAGQPWTWTEGPLEVVLYAGALVSRDPLDVLDRRNLLAVVHPDGVELVGFREVELLPGGPRRYRLTGLLRGQRGTDHLSAAPLSAGAPVALLDGTQVPVNYAPDEPGRPLWLRYGPSARPVTEHQVAQITPQGAGFRPPAPAHLASTANGGDTELAWLRRTRLPVTGSLASSPAFQDAERYRVRIGPAGAPVREVQVTAPAWTYTAADKTADGIAPPFEVRVAQVGEEWGAGPETLLTVED